MKLRTLTTLFGKGASGPEKTCSCCGGVGEHDTGFECYRCDSGGTVPKDSSDDERCDGRYNDGGPSHGFGPLGPEGIMCVYPHPTGRRTAGEYGADSSMKFGGVQSWTQARQYGAEDRMELHLPEHPISSAEEAQKIADKVTKHAQVRPVAVTHTPGRNYSFAQAHPERGTPRIVLGDGGMNHQTLLHELAHHIDREKGTQDPGEPHGDSFRDHFEKTLVDHHPNSHVAREAFRDKFHHVDQYMRKGGWAGEGPNPEMNDREKAEPPVPAHKPIWEHDPETLAKARNAVQHRTEPHTYRKYMKDYPELDYEHDDDYERGDAHMADEDLEKGLSPYLVVPHLLEAWVKHHPNPKAMEDPKYDDEGAEVSVRKQSAREYGVYGPPDRWYHASPHNLEEEGFQEGHVKRGADEEAGKHWNSHLGIHVTSDHATARELAEGVHGMVHHVSLSMKHPKHYASENDLTSEVHSWTAAHPDYGRDLPRTEDPEYSGHLRQEDQLRHHPRIAEVGRAFRDRLRSQGHDGITYGNEHEGPRGHLSAIAFSPHEAQIDGAHSWSDDDDEDLDDRPTQYADGRHTAARSITPRRSALDSRWNPPHEEGADRDAHSQVQSIGPVYHATRAQHWPPSAEESPHLHFGTLQAAHERIASGEHSYGATPQHEGRWRLFEAHLQGPVHPHHIYDDEAQEVPYTAGYDTSRIYPYENETEDAGSTSFLAPHHTVKRWREISAGSKTAAVDSDPGLIHRGLSVVLPEHIHKFIEPVTKRAGLHGDLPEGLTYEHTVDKGLHTLLAQHPDMPGDKHFAGVLGWWDKDGEIGGVEVHPQMQRRGLGTELYRRAKEITPHLQHSEYLTPDAKQWISGMDHQAGANGDLPKGLTFEHNPPSRRYPDEHSLVARHPSLHPNQAGHITWFDDTGVVAGIKVHPDLRRRGLATELWNRARQITPHLQHDDPENRTDDGKAWTSTTATRADSGPVPEGTRGEDSQGHRVEMTPQDGWAHRDGSHGHEDGPDVGERPVYTQDHTWLPEGRYWGPNSAQNDQRLFQGDHLRPEVRQDILDRVGGVLGKYGDWQKWTRVYFAGSQAAQWLDQNGQGNGDFDILIGMDFTEFRDHNPQFEEMEDQEIATTLTDELWAEANVKDYFFTLADGKKVGPFDRTFFINAHAWDIKDIHPYAAYNVTSDDWAVHPLQVPKDWAATHLPESYWGYAEALVHEIQAIGQLPAEERHRMAANLWEELHTHRSDAFADGGHGLFDLSNIIMKYLEAAPGNPWAQLVQWKNESPSGHSSWVPTTARRTTLTTLFEPKTAADGADYGGVMIAIVPPKSICKALAQEGGEPVDAMHVTLAYIPKQDRRRAARVLPELVEGWARTQTAMTARIGGAGTFVNPGKHVLWAAVDIPNGGPFRQSLVETLERHGFAVVNDHGWTPHITLDYRDHHFRFLPKVEPVSWDVKEVHVCVGDDWTAVKLG